jgi:hypothetical protein
VTRARLFAALAAAALAAAPLSAAPEPEPKPCARMVGPRRLTTAPVTLPVSFTATRIGGIVVDEAIVSPDGAVSDIRPVRERVQGLAPFAKKSVQDSKFEGALIDGNPLRTRVQIATTLGTVSKARIEPEYDVVWAHVPGGASREAQWQLAESVERLTVTVHLGTDPGAGGEIVAVAPDGKERSLLRLPSAAAPVDARETVATERFFFAAGDYRLELRASGKPVAWTTVTIADDFTRAIVNACAPL